MLKTANDFGTNQLRLFFYVLSQIPRGADTIPPISVDVHSILQILGIELNDSGWRHHVKTTLDDLATRLVYAIDTESNLYRMTWFDYIRQDASGSNYVFQLRKSLEPFLLRLTREFTRYQFAYLLQFQSSYAIKLYDCFQGFSFRGDVTLSLDEFRQLMSLKRFDQDGNIIADKYPTYENLARKVVRPAIKEINETSDLYVTFEPVKDISDRRKFSGIRFVIQEKENPPVYDYVIPSATLSQDVPFPFLPHDDGLADLIDVGCDPENGEAL